MNIMSINGKSIDSVMTELSKEFPESAFLSNPAGFPYIPYEMFRERLDEVIGIFNYDFTISQLEWVSVGRKPSANADNKLIVPYISHVSLVGTLTVKDDEGHIVTQKSATGGADIIFREEDGKAVKPGNDSKIAAQDAFKSCCRMLGVCDEQLRDKRKERKGKGKESTTSNEKLYTIHLTGSFASAGKKGFKAPAVLVDTGEKISLVIWESGVAEIEKYIPFSKFSERYRDMDFQCYGTRGKFNMKNGTVEEQLTLTRPSVKERSN